jgi:dienelactone hydrolase
MDMSPGTWDPALFEPVDFEVIESVDGVDGILFPSVPFHGVETNAFAWIGLPDQYEMNTPGMVLVHGGGGNAVHEWVKKWNERGYAAISMDMNGRGRDAEKLPNGGPDLGHPEIFATDLAWTDMWTYHSIAAVIRSHSILRSQIGLDAKIGVTGISWGGYTTCIAAGVDDRYACAIPVYGCGHLDHDSAWLFAFDDMSVTDSVRWREWCDPSSYVGKARMPMLFVNGTNDFAYVPESHDMTARLPQGPVTMCVQFEMGHSHQDGWAPPEIARFADHIIRDGPGLTNVGEVKLDGMTACASVWADAPPVRGGLLYTRDTGTWQERKWYEEPAEVCAGELSADIPEGTTAFYLTATDADGMYVSSMLTQLGIT